MHPNILMVERGLTTSPDGDMCRQRWFVACDGLPATSAPGVKVRRRAENGGPHPAGRHSGCRRVYLIVIVLQKCIPQLPE
jgi:hypothetical protein